ncbi:ABC-three component system middle component 6 [Mucilaginibacter rivuli]|uniref:ABC-three component system middle component 6 n=1 Tax=Mucilaginibacter rivuli TaxID=2857527 RepID=UPI0034E22017
MLIPSKHENLEYNLLVIGSDILRILRTGNHNIEELFQTIKKYASEISLDKILDCILYLWLCEFVIVEDNVVILNRNN